MNPDDEEDEIIAGSTVFALNEDPKSRQGSRDLTDMGMLKKTNKKLFFESIFLPLT